MAAVVDERVARHQPQSPGPCKKRCKKRSRLRRLQALEAAAAGWAAEKRLRGRRRRGHSVRGLIWGNSPPGCSRRSLVGGQTESFLEHHQWHALIYRVQRTCPAAEQSPVCLTANALPSGCLGKGQHVWIVGSGWEGAYSLEDHSWPAQGLSPPQPRTAGLKGRNGGSRQLTETKGPPWRFGSSGRHDPEPACDLASHGKRTGGHWGTTMPTSLLRRRWNNRKIVPKIRPEPGVLRPALTQTPLGAA